MLNAVKIKLADVRALAPRQSKDEQRISKLRREVGLPVTTPPPPR